MTMPKDPQPDFSDVHGGSSSDSVSDTAATQETYTVKAGDSLSKIARQRYGDGNKWHAIFDANRDTIKNPDLIHPGQVLRIPPL
jgi:nucleoid-associated protein YgaU